MIHRKFSHPVVWFLSVIAVMSCSPRPGDEGKTASETMHRQMIGDVTPSETPEVWGVDFLSTHRHERDFTLRNDGKELFFSYALPGFTFTAILSSTLKGDQWTSPEVATFSGSYNDLEPAFSPDGNSLLFISKRPLNSTDTTNDWNIWIVHRKDNSWLEPTPVDLPFNTEGNEFYPSVAANGNLYFTASLEDSFGGEDIYCCPFENGAYLKPINLGESINSPLPEFNAFIAPDERYILFSSYGRKDGLGGGDLYISFRDVPGATWMAALHMGKGINSEQIDYCPFVGPDGDQLFFTSERIDTAFGTHNRKNLTSIHHLEDRVANGLGDIYRVKFDSTAWYQNVLRHQ